MTDEERALKVEEMTGINIAEFIRDVCAMDPFGNDGLCIFCKEESCHAVDCKWVLIGGAP